MQLYSAVNHPFCLSINQPNNQSIKQSVSQSINQSINQTISQLTSYQAVVNWNKLWLYYYNMRDTPILHQY